MGRGRPRRHRPQRRGDVARLPRRQPCGRSSRPTATGTARRRPPAQRWPGAQPGSCVALDAGGGRAARRRDRRARSWCSASSRPTELDERDVAHRPRPHRVLASRRCRPSPRPAGATIRCTSRSTPGCAGSGAAADDASELAAAIDEVDVPSRLAGVYTHLAVADEPDDPFTATQLESFDDVLAALARGGHQRADGARRELRRRARASRQRGSTWCVSASRCTASRPVPASIDLAAALRPALSLRARVSHVKRVRAGERHLVRPADTGSTATRRWPHCRSATPTVCRGACSIAAARC